MSDFMPEPKVHLHSADDLIEYLNNHPDNYPKKEHSQFYPPFDDDVNETKCDFIIDCVREVERLEGCSYHASVWTMAMDRLGFEKIQYHKWWDNQRNFPFTYKLIYILVCKNCSYAHSDDMKNAGYQTLTQELIDLAYKNKQKIETTSKTVYNIRQIDGKNYAMKPRVRNHCLGIEGQPVKLV